MRFLTGINYLGPADIEWAISGDVCYILQIGLLQVIKSNRFKALLICPKKIRIQNLQSESTITTRYRFVEFVHQMVYQFLLGIYLRLTRKLTMMESEELTMDGVILWQSY